MFFIVAVVVIVVIISIVVIQGNKRRKALLAKAEQGDAQAQYDLGVRCMSNDLEKAMHWFDKAAKQDFEEAQFKLELVNFAKQNGMKLGSNSEGRKLYGKMVNYADPPINSRGCQCVLGQWYLCGFVFHGTSNTVYDIDYIGKDVSKAVYWLKRAAEQGDTDAQNELNRIKTLER